MKSVKEIVAAIRSVVDRGPPLCASNLHLPSIGIGERASVVSELLTNIVGYGALDQFQAKIAEVSGTEQALCVNSGTAALHLALMVAGVKQNEEVLMPALTFIATANAVSYTGAVPHLVDIRQWDLGIHPFKLQRYLERIAERRDGGTYNKKTERRIAAIIAVDLLGYPADMDAINAEAGRWGLPVVEDAAEALGSRYKGRPCGSSAFVGVLSFNNNKIITTNGGGALLTNDAFVQANAWELATTARLGHPWLMGNHTRIGWNYRMGNINAALAIPQLDRLEELVAAKQKLHRAYCENLSVGIEAELEGEPVEGNRWNCWLNALTLEPMDHRRDEICAAIIAQGIACRTLFTPLHMLPFFKECPRDNLDTAVDVWKRTICLPSSPQLGAAL